MEKKKAIVGAVSVLIVLCAVGTASWLHFREPASVSETEVAVTEAPVPAPAATAAETNDSDNTIDRAVGSFGNYEMRLHRVITDIGGAHPEVGNWYEVMDVSAKRAVKIDELFPESDLAAAIAAVIEDDVYSQDAETAEDFKKLKRASSLEAMKGLLAKFPAELMFMTEQCEEAVELNPHTDNFAIVAFDPASGKSDVHLGIFARTHLCKSAFPRLRLRVDTPSALRADLEAAASKKKGFLPDLATLRVCDACDPIDVAKLALAGP